MTKGLLLAMVVGCGGAIGTGGNGNGAWDPRSDTYYVSSMSNPLLRLDCSR